MFKNGCEVYIIEKLSVEIVARDAVYQNMFKLKLQRAFTENLENVIKV